MTPPVDPIGSRRRFGAPRYGTAIATGLITLAALAGHGDLRAGGFEASWDGKATIPFVQWVGHDSLRAEPGYVLVRDETAWHDLWARHRGGPEGEGAIARHFAPKVDFDRCMVVAHFRGRVVNGDGEVVGEVREFDDHVRIRFESSTFQTFGFDDRGGAVNAQPYGIWVIERSDKPVVVERAVRALKKADVEWHEAARFQGH